jgi:hypothetical protein
VAAKTEATAGPMTICAGSASQFYSPARRSALSNARLFRAAQRSRSCGVIRATRLSANSHLLRSRFTRRPGLCPADGIRLTQLWLRWREGRPRLNPAALRHPLDLLDRSEVPSGTRQATSRPRAISRRRPATVTRAAGEKHSSMAVCSVMNLGSAPSGRSADIKLPSRNTPPRGPFRPGKPRGSTHAREAQHQLPSLSP